MSDWIDFSPEPIEFADQPPYGRLVGAFVVAVFVAAFLLG